MSAELNCHLETLLCAAIEINDAAEREVFLDRACGTDDELREQVSRLVADHFRAGGFLNSRAPGISDTMALPTLEKAGSRIGNYKLHEQIGEGGMGIVFMAEQVAPVRRRVAIKITKPGMDSGQVIARFEAERQALAMMNHPNIAKILDAGATESGRPYFVMELVKGIPITEYCDTHKLTTRQRLELLVPICGAVQHAHQKGIIHRDLKPGNILVELHDVRPVPKVVDFGIAKSTIQRLTERTLCTNFSQMIGTPLYMSPEQAQLSGVDVDTRSDIYSLGVLLYELITGTTPFTKEAMSKIGYDEMRRKIQFDDPPRPSDRISTLNAAALTTLTNNQQVDSRKLQKQVRNELDWVVMKALDKDRTRRYQSATALEEDIQRYLNNEPVLVCPPTFWYRCRKSARRNKSLLVTGLAITCVMLVGSIASIVQAVRATKAEYVSEQRFLSEQEARIAEVEARTDAEKAKNLALQNADSTYRQQYRAEMQLGLVDLKTGNVSRLYQSLVAHLPNPQRADRRGWEWFYLLSRCQEGRTFCEHYSHVSSLAWSPDGRHLATTSYDGDAIVWDARSGERVRRFSFSSNFKRGVAWSPDSQRLAWGSVDNENAVRIWDRRTDEVHVLRGHEFSLVSCTWSPNGSRLATTAMDKTARIWDAETWKCLHVLRGHSHHVNASCWVADSRTLVTAGDGGVKVWDAQTGELLRELLSDANFHSISMSSSVPQQLVLGTRGKCLLIETVSWQETQEIPAHAGPVAAVAFSPDGAAFASGGADGTAIIWDAAEGRQLFVLRGHQGAVTSLAWNPNGSQVAAGCSDGTVKVWEVPAPRQPMAFQRLSEPIQSFTWSENNRLLTSLGDSARTTSNPATGEAVQTTSFAAKTRESTSPNGQLRASVSGAEGVFKILVENVEPHKTVCELQFSGIHRENRLPTMLWSPNSKRLVARTSRQVDVWEIPGGQRQFTWQGPFVEAASWASDNSRLAIAGGGDSTDNGNQAAMGHVHVFDVERKIRLLKVGLGSSRIVATAVAWHPNGESLAAGNGIGQVVVRDASTGRPLTIAQMHTAAANALDWSPDGLRMASVSDDGSLKVWDPLTGDELLSLADGTQSLTAVKWSSDSTRLTAGDDHGLIQIWDASAGYDLVSRSDQRRSLSSVHQRLARQNFEREDLPGALAEITLAIGLAPSRPSYRLFRAKVHARQKHLEAAMADLTAALDLDPDDTHVLRAHLDMNAELGRWTEALTDTSKLKQNSVERYQQAIIHLMIGQVDEYRDICERSFVGDPEEWIPEAEIRAWTCALIPEAVTDFERMLTILRESRVDGSYSRPGSLGALLYRAGHPKEAFDLLIEESRNWEQSGSIVLPGSYYDLLPGYTWYFLAMACHDLGRFAESQAWYEKAEAYTQKVLVRPAVDAQLNSSNWLRLHSVNWHQRVVLEILQREARKVMGVANP